MGAAAEAAASERKEASPNIKATVKLPVSCFPGKCPMNTDAMKRKISHYLQYDGSKDDLG